MKVSCINESTENYGADLSMRHYYNEAKKRGHGVFWNVVNSEIDVYLIGMFFAPMEKKLQGVLKPKKYIYIEHSLELCQSYNIWLRDWMAPNAHTIYFFSPRHRQHIEDGLPSNYKHLTIDNFDYLVVPVDDTLFKPDPTIIRENNLYLFVGMIHSNKGILEFVQMAKNHPEWNFIVAGTTEGGNVNPNILKAYPNIQYLGHQSQTELVKLYSRARYCCLLPTNGAVESAGRTIFEAVLCGCIPIVNNDVGNASYRWYRFRDLIIKNMHKSTDLLFCNIQNIGDNS